MTKANKEVTGLSPMTILVIQARNTTLERGSGAIVCMREEVIPIDQKNCFIPCNLI